MQLFEALLDTRPTHSSSLLCSTEAKPLEAVGPPFARVMVVVAGSPADSAGLKQGDSMTKFGSVTKVSRSIHSLPMFTISDVQDNFTGLKNISDVAESSRGRGVEVEVVRAGRVTRLRLVPRPWAGAGIIGFKIRPVAEEDSGVDR